MRKNIYILFLFVIPHTLFGTISNPLKVLHLSFHTGCIKDFEVVGKELGLEVTSWFIHEKSHTEFDGYSPASSGAIYNIGHERARRIWEKHKNYFNSFDVIVTSDTAPLSRIFLQNGWKKPLIIWICNRFDYVDCASLDCHFPDPEYYDLIKKAVKQKNVKVIGYVAYEHFYARSRGVDTGNLIIKPCGSLEEGMRSSGQSYIPQNIKKEETFFIIPRLEPHQVANLASKCNQLGIKSYCGKYNGPYDLKNFKGIIHIPYQWSNLALFENLQLGLIHFIPSIKFARDLYHSSERNLYRYISESFAHLELSEWYCPEHKDVIVYFDSWSDLARKIQHIDYQSWRNKIKLFGKQHQQEMLNRWKSVFLDVQKG